MSKVIELEEGEYIVNYTRKHWWGIFVWGIGTVALAFLPIIFLVMYYFFAQGQGHDLYINFIGMLYCFWLTALWVLFFVEWTDYYLDVWVVTNHRVVDIDHIGLFSRDVSTVRLEDIEDITTEVHGILAITLKYGTITLQTAGSKDEFYLYNANNPEKARQTIYALVGDAKKRIEENH